MLSTFSLHIGILIRRRWHTGFGSDVGIGKIALSRTLKPFRFESDVFGAQPGTNRPDEIERTTHTKLPFRASNLQKDYTGPKLRKREA
jgi:hypothetical protein